MMMTCRICWVVIKMTNESATCLLVVKHLIRRSLGRMPEEDRFGVLRCCGGKRESDGCSEAKSSELSVSASRVFACGCGACKELPYPIYDSNNPHTCFFSIPSLAAHPAHPPLAIIMALPVEDEKNDAAASQAIKGSLPPKVKRMLDSVLHELMARPNVFGAAIGERIVITEASIVPKAEESSRSEARVVCEVTVAEGLSVRVHPIPDPHIKLNRKLKLKTLLWDATRARFDYQLDMLNPEGSLHGGCAAFLIDAYVSSVFPTDAPTLSLLMRFFSLFCTGAPRSCSSPPPAVLVCRQP